jgi:hypothetical protein
MHGKGTMTWKDRSTYIGEFKENRIEGFGLKKFANGDQFNGDWVNDMMNGTGTLTKASGEKITGHWVDDELAPEDVVDQGTPWKHMRRNNLDGGNLDQINGAGRRSNL